MPPQISIQLATISVIVWQNNTYLWVFHNKIYTYTSQMNELMTLRRIIGGNIRLLRKARGWSQEELGERAALSYKFVGEIERGAANPSLDSLLGIANALNVEVAKLFLNQQVVVLTDDDVSSIESALAVLNKVLNTAKTKPY